jgi:hypothetical protein
LLPSRYSSNVNVWSLFNPMLNNLALPSNSHMWSCTILEYNITSFNWCNPKHVATQETNVLMHHTIRHLTTLNFLKYNNLKLCEQKESWPNHFAT